VTVTICVEITDATFGRPAEGVLITLAHLSEARWHLTDTTKTNSGGRVRLPTAGAGRHRLTLDLDGYFAALGMSAIQSRTDFTFRLVSDEDLTILVTVTPSSLTAVAKSG
jgi:5-hydroxyisourate hydrolase-like protein (transthyretin family)